MCNYIYILQAYKMYKNLFSYYSWTNSVICTDFALVAGSDLWFQLNTWLTVSTNTLWYL